MQHLLDLDRLLQIFLGDRISLGPAEVRDWGGPLSDRSGRNAGGGRRARGPELDPSARADHPRFLLFRLNDEERVRGGSDFALGGSETEAGARFAPGVRDKNPAVAQFDFG